MALPTIYFNNSTGSDSNSGSGGTAVSGTAASVGATATSVSITDAVDLSGVPVDGSAVLYYVDTTAGHRRFDQITAISGSSGAWTVTVANGFSTTTGPFTWSIGGKRASISSTTSQLLVNNNAAAGDAMPGWTLQMDSGHVETWTPALTLTWKRSGSAAVGFIMLQGDPAAVTRPIINVTTLAAGANSALAVGGLNYIKMAHFDMKIFTNDNFYGAIGFGGTMQQFIDLRFLATASVRWYNGLYGTNNANNCLIRDCYFQYCASNGAVNWQGSVTVENCRFEHISTAGGAITIALFQGGSTVADCTFYNNSIPDIKIVNFNGGGYGPVVIRNNSSDRCQAEFFYVSVTNPGTSILVINNAVANAVGAAVRTADTDTVTAIFTTVLNNDTYNCNLTGGVSTPYKSTTAAYAYNACPWASGDPGINPGFCDSMNGDFTPTNSALQAAYPTSAPSSK